MTGIDEWLASAVGRRMNPDGRYGLQCVDAVDQYAEDLFGVPWPQSVGGVAGARQLLDAAPDEYWERIDYYHGFVPQRGDVLVFAGDSLNQWGHTAVVESADNVGINVIQQDGFAPPTRFVDGAYYSDKPAHRARLAYSDRGTGRLSGVLRPRPNKIIGIQLQSGTTTTPLEEIDVAAEEKILARLSEIVAWQDNQFQEIRDTQERNRNALAGFVRDVVAAGGQITAAEIDAKFKQLIENPAPSGQVLFKGPGADVFAWDPGTGLRHIGQDEYEALRLAGVPRTDVPQDVFDRIAGGK